MGGRGVTRSWMRWSILEEFDTPDLEFLLGEVEKQAVTYLCCAHLGLDDDAVHVSQGLDCLELDHDALRYQQQ